MSVSTVGWTEQQRLVLAVVLAAAAFMAVIQWAAPRAQATYGVCATADSVVAYSPGANLLVEFPAGTPNPNRNPNNALGPEDGKFVSLGRGGSITLGFSTPIAEGTGNDMFVIEVQGNDVGVVAVSADGVNFFDVGTISGPGPAHLFTLTSSGLASASFVRITDTSTPTATNSPTAGLDIDAVYAVNCGTAENPAIAIEKFTNGEDADNPTGPFIPVGGAVNWTYVVTNTGNVALSNVVVTDDQGVTVTCPATSLAVGETMTCTASGTAAAGQYANLGTVTGQSPAGQTVQDSDASHYFGKPSEILGAQGCTPGYWKQSQHFDSWVGTGLTTGDDFDATFGVNLFTPDITLLQALKQGGGGKNALGRHAVAALLNAYSTDVAYQYTSAQVIAMVQNAAATGNYEPTKNLLDAANNGGCSLN